MRKKAKMKMKKDGKKKGMILGMNGLMILWLEMIKGKRENDDDRGRKDGDQRRED